MLLKGDSITKNFIAKCCPHQLPLQLLECLGASEHKIGENALKARDTGGWQEENPRKLCCLPAKLGWPSENSVFTAFIQETSQLNTGRI